MQHLDTIRPIIEGFVASNQSFSDIHRCLYQDCGYGKSLRDIYQMSADNTNTPIEYFDTGFPDKVLPSIDQPLGSRTIPMNVQLYIGSNKQASLTQDEYGHMLSELAMRRWRK